jgi:hypothetical protein
VIGEEDPCARRRAVDPEVDEHVARYEVIGAPLADAGENATVTLLGVAATTPAFTPVGGSGARYATTSFES